MVTTEPRVRGGEQVSAPSGPGHSDVFVSSGMFRLLPGEVQAPDLQQGVRVPRLGHRSGLVSGLGLHGLHPTGDGHQDPAVRGTTD